MSLWERITHVVGEDMDAKVAAHGGVSAQRYSALVDDDALCVLASVENATAARVELRSVAGAHTLSAGSVHAVALGHDLRGQQLHIVAHIEAATDPAELVVLRVEVFTQKPGAGPGARAGSQMYTVEARLDAGQRSKLELELDLA